MLNTTILDQKSLNVSFNNNTPTDQAYDQALINAVHAWEKALGADRISFQVDAYQKNTIASNRSIPAIVKLVNTEEIASAIKIAQKYNIKVYPISTGNNWGYGSTLPVTENCVIFDLKGMNKIVDFDSELGTVTVEPGVTQQMLYEFLLSKNANFLVPVTGAGPDCSILGNALERGYGITPHTDHFAAVNCMTAVLPNGDVYKSNFSDVNAEQIDKLHKWGLGPYLDGIFTQSNMGIVSQITIELKKKPECIEFFTFKINSDKKLEEITKVINEILEEVGDNLSGINLMNDNRVISMSADFPYEELNPDGSNHDEVFNRIAKRLHITPWTGIGAIYGSKEIVKAVKKIISRKLKNVAGFTLFINRKKINFIKFIYDHVSFIQRPFLSNLIEKVDSTLKILEGVPQKVAIPLAYWKNKATPYQGHDKNHNPAHDNCGLIWFTPLIPLKQKDIRQYTDTVKRICKANKIEPLITMTTLSEKVVDSSVPILFDRKNAEDVKNAKKCYMELFEECSKMGYLPYRMGVDNMFLATENKTSYWNLVKQIKDTIDPANILSPGRYCPI